MYFSIVVCILLCAFTTLLIYLSLFVADYRFATDLRPIKAIAFSFKKMKGKRSKVLEILIKSLTIAIALPVWYMTCATMAKKIIFSLLKGV